MRDFTSDVVIASRFVFFFPKGIWSSQGQETRFWTFLAEKKLQGKPLPKLFSFCVVGTMLQHHCDL
jgi:hypothetical protein